MPRTPQSQQGGQHGAPQDEYLDDQEFEEGAPAERDEDSDEGLEGEEQEVDEGEDVSPQELGEPPPRRRPSRDATQLQERLARLEQENEILRRATPQAPAPAGPREESDQEFEQRMATLDPLEAMGHRQQRSERRNQNQLLYLQASTQDALDKAQYQMRAASDGRYARHADEVERRHQALLMGGAGQAPALVSRELILKQLLGERLLSSSNRDQRRQGQREQKPAPQQSVRRGRPLDTRGDTGGGRPQRMGQQETEREARRKRLENVEI